MNYKRVLSSYNEQIKSWDFKKDQLPKYLRLLSDRNALIAEQTPLIDYCPDCEAQSKNSSFIKYSQSNTEHLAFHVGAPHQKRLYSLMNKQFGVPQNKGVFFSFDPSDTVFFFGDDDDPAHMIYFLNLACAKEARVQINYSSGVISRYDVDDMLATEHIVDKDLLKKRFLELTEKWVIENTVPFNIDEIREIKKKYYCWLILPGPVDVQY